MFAEDKKWETDAGNISDYEKFDRFVYRNGTVDAFLNDDGKFFIIAAKGMGKTLLLSYKRYLLEERYRDKNSSSVIFIPTNHPYLSFVESIKTTLSSEHISKLKDWEYCKKMWVLVIELSILSYANIDVDVFLTGVPARAERHIKMLKNLLGRPNSAEYIFNEIVNLSESAITQFVRDVSNSIGTEFCRISKGIIMFFDRFDNALETSHDSIWQSIQVGLLEAAWDVMRSNHHVKIYLSIRQEAYAAHRSRNANAISAAVVKIEYSRKELKELLNHLVFYYENVNTLEEFVGFDTFPNTVVFEDENIYDFMFRYSIGRPRDFVQFCDELSKIRNSLDGSNIEKRLELKERVRNISSDMIVFSLFEELRMLLKCLNTQERFNDFLALLKCNVLTYSEMQEICCEFNGKTCDRMCDKCSHNHHPFCDLYNMGLLGVVSNNQDRRTQHFKTPYENMIHGLRSDIDFFLIHPALREYINQIHMSTSKEYHYFLFVGILIGEGLPWLKRYDDLCVVNNWIAQLKTPEVHNLFYNIMIKYVKSKCRKVSGTKFEKLKSNTFAICERKTIDSLVTFFTKKTIVNPKPISIFVSYAFDNEKHQERVIGFVNMLRNRMGFDAQMDSSLKEFYPDIDQMMTQGLQMDKIIIVLSEMYKKKADAQTGGVWKEFKMIADDLEKNPKKYIFVSFDKYSEVTKEKISPIRIGNRWVVDLDKGYRDDYNELIAFITEEKEYPFSDVN